MLRTKQDQADYMLNIQEYAEKNGHDTDVFLEASSKLAGKIADGAAEGNPKALMMQQQAQMSSEYLSLLTEKYLSQQVREKAKVAESKRDTEAGEAGAVKSTSSSPEKQRTDPADFSEKEIMGWMSGK